MSVVTGLILEGLLLGLVSFEAIRVGCVIVPPSADLLDRTAVSGMVAVVGWVALLQVLGLLGILWLPAIVVCLLGLAVSVWLLFPAPQPLPSSISRVPWSLAGVVIFFGALAVAEVFSGPPAGYFSFDSVNYHIPNAAAILDSGSIRNLPFAAPGTQGAAAPGNGGLLLLIVMLPFHTAGAIALVPLAVDVLLVVMVTALVRELGGTTQSGLVSGLVIVTSWIFFATQVRSAYDDGVGLVGLVGGITFGFRAERSREARWLLLSGMCLGLAIGTRMTDLLPGVAAAIAVAVVTHAWRQPSRAALFVLLFAALGSWWYIRNWIDAGDPVFPQTIRIGPLMIFRGLAGSAYVFHAVDQSVLISVLQWRAGALSAWLRNLVAGYGVLVLMPGMFLVCAVRARGRPTAVFLVAVACIAAYLATPFTGSVDGNQGDTTTRYLLPSLTLGVAALAVVMPRRWARLAAFLAIGVNAPIVVLNQPSGDLALAGAAVISAVALLALRWRRVLFRPIGPRLFRPALLTALGVPLVVTLAALQPTGNGGVVQAALAKAGELHAPVVLLDVGDVAAALGPHLNIDVVAAGIGPVGAEEPISDPHLLMARVDSLRPALVLVGPAGPYGTTPPGWKPPGSWRKIGTQAGATVYQA
jgi:hypothetical protein